MKPHEELRAQREAVMSGTWVQRQPESVGEACAVARAEEVGPVDAGLEIAGIEVNLVGRVEGDLALEWSLSPMATRALTWAIAEGWPLILESGQGCCYPFRRACQSWNDETGRLLSEVVDVLFRAEVIAKESA